jgi:putative transcriptional regulator
MLLDFSFTNNLLPQTGSILISDPFLDEDFFRRSAVLICEHNDEGTFGLVLNNFIELGIHEIESDFPEINNFLSIGGPVETEHLFFVHSFGSDVKNSLQIRKDLFFGGDYNQLKEKINHDPTKGDVRFFLGYSGWAPKQLDEEIKTHAWIVVNNITSKEILSPPNQDFWMFCMEKQGGRFKSIARAPINPNNN